MFGNIRVSVLSSTLIRFEERGPHGFEDRNTFLVVDRSGPGAEVQVEELATETTLTCGKHVVIIPRDANSLRQLVVREAGSGDFVWRLDGALPGRPALPTPVQPGRVWALADSIRIVPPPWGACPPPEGNTLHPDVSGWDLTNDSPDVYLFLHGGDLSAWRRDFIKLTGPVPMPPKWAFGYWHSLYYPYTQKEALDIIDEHRKRDYPLDVFVVDTDWRVGGSGGYDVEMKLFPDMEKFLTEAHARSARIVFNDHPQPNGMQPLEPKMLKFRSEGLTKFLQQGVDAWWYDLNWVQIIDGPWGIDRAVWGQMLYFDIADAFDPEKRTMIMSMRSEHPASHRYPIWWTGDIASTYETLADGLRDSINDGVRLQPYVNIDLGGHFGQPDDELYVRYLQYGCLCPITRVHGTRRDGLFRYPWLFGREAADTIRDYVKLRYRLMPTLYAGARRTYEDGVPFVRKLVFEWPDHPEAQASDQHLLGDDILVSPIVNQAPRGQEAGRMVWIPPGHWEDAWTGETLTGPRTLHVHAPTNRIPMHIRRGGLVLLGPDMLHTAEKPWDTITVEAYPEAGQRQTRSLYEDDGETKGYQKGVYLKTPLTLESDAKRIHLTIGKPEGSWTGAPSQRNWLLRFHLRAGQAIRGCRVNGQPRASKTIEPSTIPPIVFKGRSQSPGPHAGIVVEVEVTAGSGQVVEVEIAI